MAVTVTDEMRRAVYEEDCKRLGHMLAYENAMRLEGRAGQVIGPDGKQAHIECRRCGKVWLVVEEPGDGYEAATVALDARLLPQHRPARVRLGSGKPGLSGLL